MSKERKQYKHRSYAREQLMQLLFQMEFQNNFSVHEKKSFTDVYEVNDSEKDYFDSTYEIAVKNKKDIDQKIRRYSKNWSFDRISKVDLSIMRLALAEILYNDDVPDSVSINEAVEMAKKFSGEKSGKFVNGILGEITRSKDA